MINMNIISEFRGETRWLSNFQEAPILYMGKTYKTVEHMYQAYKSPVPEERLAIMTAETPGRAKRMGALCKLRPDWEEIKFGIMFHAVLCKFLQHKDLAERLLATGDAILEEGNDWGDTYWGICNGEGFNHLGKILMRVRDILGYSQIHIEKE